MEITVNLSEKACQHIYRLSLLNKQSIDEVIEESLENRFQREADILRESVKSCSDKEVLNLAKLKMSEKENERFSLLMEKQRKNKLSEKEKAEFENSIETSRMADIRKAIGIVEALKRGIIASVNDLT